MQTSQMTLDDLQDGLRFLIHFVSLAANEFNDLCFGSRPMLMYPHSTSLLMKWLHVLLTVNVLSARSKCPNYHRTTLME